MSDTLLLIVSVVGLAVFFVAIWWYQKRGLEDQPDKPHFALMHRREAKDQDKG